MFYCSLRVAVQPPTPRKNVLEVGSATRKLVLFGPARFQSQLVVVNMVYPTGHFSNRFLLKRLITVRPVFYSEPFSVGMIVEYWSIVLPEIVEKMFYWETSTRSIAFQPGLMPVKKVDQPNQSKRFLIEHEKINQSTMADSSNRTRSKLSGLLKKYSRHFIKLSKVKPKLMLAHSQTFSRASCRLYIYICFKFWLVY